MSDQGDETDGPLWADGDMMFRVAGAGGEPDRLVKVRRPFALIGRAADADIAIDDRAVSARHAYLHLDPRGVYAVDLVTRTGTRINGTEPDGRLAPPRRLGRGRRPPGRAAPRPARRGRSSTPRRATPTCSPTTPTTALVGVTLEPRRSNDPPWVLGSELVFLGWSASCGIQVKDAAVARTHCALVRTPAGRLPRRPLRPTDLGRGPPRPRRLGRSATAT